MGICFEGLPMKLKRSTVVAALALFFGASFTAQAITYTTPGSIFFPAPAPGPLGGFGSVSGIIVTDGTLGPLSDQNSLDFQIGVFNGMASSDISSPARSGTGFVTISGNAFFASPTGLYFNFENSSSAYVLFERDSGAQGISFLCLDAGGADCSGGHFDIAVQAGSTGLFGRPRSDIWNFGGVLSASGVLQIGTIGAIPNPQHGPCC
jgi:hypothetical protein